MRKIFLAGVIALAAAQAFAQSAILRGEISAGSYENIKTDGAQALKVSPVATDPCQSPAVAKSSVTVGITTAATTQLVALSGTTVIYVCEFGINISQVATTANTLKFVQGTGANCGTGTADLTGLFGAGGITAAAPIFVTSGAAGTAFKTAAGNALCVTTAIGATAFFQGWVTYVQQ